MGTRPEPEPQAVTEAEEREAFVRSFVAGHPQGAIRRIVLYVVLGVTIVAGIQIDGVAGLLLAIAGMICLILLAVSDQLA